MRDQAERFIEQWLSDAESWADGVCDGDNDAEADIGGQHGRPGLTEESGRGHLQQSPLCKS